MQLTTKQDENSPVKAARKPQERRGDKITLSGGGGGALTVILPILPPSTNHLYKAVPRRRSKAKGGGTYMGKELSDQAVAFQKLAIYEARITANMTGWKVPEGPLKLTILITFGTRRARQDIDNRAKWAIDCLASALGFDDSRIYKITIERVGVDPKRPLCEMILEALS